MLLSKGVHKYHTPPWQAVVICCDSISIDQKAYSDLENKFKGKGGVTFVEGLPLDHEEEFYDMLRENQNENWSTIVIFDDL